MFNVVLYQPEIPPNTGNIIRLCANAGCSLHLIKPIGFRLEDKKLRRAGLDYREFVEIQVWENLKDFLSQSRLGRTFAATTKGKSNYSEVQFESGDNLLFGPETKGLPKEVLCTLSNEQKIRIPMKKGSRSLNLANAVSIIVYEAWKQIGFDKSGI